MAKRQREREKAEKRRAKSDKIALRRAQKNSDDADQPLAATTTDGESPGEAP